MLSQGQGRVGAEHLANTHGHFPCPQEVESLGQEQTQGVKTPLTMPLASVTFASTQVCLPSTDIHVKKGMTSIKSGEGDCGITFNSTDAIALKVFLLFEQ